MKRHHALLIGLSMTSALMFGAPTLAAQPAPASSIAAARATPDVRAALAMLDALAAGRWAAAMHGFDAAMRQGLSPEKLRQLWQQLQQQNGAYQSHGAAVAAPAPTPYHSVLVPLRFSRATLGMLFSYDARGALAGLHIVPVAPSAATPRPTGAVAARWRGRLHACVRSRSRWIRPARCCTARSLCRAADVGPFAAVLLLPGSGRSTKTAMRPARWATPCISNWRTT